MTELRSAIAGPRFAGTLPGDLKCTMKTGSHGGSLVRLLGIREGSIHHLLATFTAFKCEVVTGYAYSQGYGDV